MLRHHRSPKNPLPRVVILGAGGFLSPVLRRNLEAHGAKVIALGTADLDLTQPGACNQLAAHIQPENAVVMAAGLTPDRGKNTATLMANLRMAESVAQALEKTRLAHFI
jgi:dTDP-4-dehydrorhamnose reductase